MILDYSSTRKLLQSEKLLPEFYTTAGYQLFHQKYEWNCNNPREHYERLAFTMAKWRSEEIKPDWWENDPYTKGKTWKEVFFNVLWEGLISPSTPMLANGGSPERGTTVSCAGGNVGNNLFDRHNSVTEAAILTKHAHGTSYCIDDWPHEGFKLKRGGHSKGILPLIQDFIKCMEETTQSSRRGSLAYSLRPEHGDFDKVLKYLLENPESNHVGWLMTDEFLHNLHKRDKTTINKFNNILYTKMRTGKGYLTFIDKMNRHLAAPFKDKGLTARASNLCQETNLIANDEYTFSCIILCYCLSQYRKWPEHLVHIGQIMSDCNISEYLQSLENLSIQDKRALNKIYKFTKEFRALGSGVVGLHTLFQQESIIVGSMDSIYLNKEIFAKLDKESLEATKWLAIVDGEPDGCKGYGIKNATRLMMPPTKSTAEIMRGDSEGIGLDTAMAFTKQSAAGEMFRVNRVLLDLMKSKGVYNEKNIFDIVKAKGSVQKVSWLNEHEKKVFKTAFEIDMRYVLRLASQRQKHIDQGQSLNLYLTSNDSEAYIGELHKLAYEDENILSLYYIYSMRGADGLVRDIESCESCSG
jgi:ribonucleoside-diphosphate reductase alpha chain